jgi:DNA-directed RNA polymerase subunit RPC12/RpoP
MINQVQAIPCPTCGNKIPFDTNQLLAGIQFICANCHSAIGLAAESKSVVQEAMQKLDATKRQMAK